MRLGQPSTSLAYAEFYECSRKRRYDTTAEAEQAAFWVETDESRPHAYECRFCDGYHIGRTYRTKNQKRKEARRRNAPTGKTLKNRPDPTMIAMIGERAFRCGWQESVGGFSHRFHVVRQRLQVIEKRRGNQRQ